MARMPDWLVQWWDAQPHAQTCRDCGKTGSKHYVQPQPPRRRGEPAPGFALCSDCISRHNERLRAKRREALALAPRCEVPGCTRRGAFRIGTGRTLMCAAHKDRARRAFMRANAGNPFALFLPPPSDRPTVIAWAAHPNPKD